MKECKICKETKGLDKYYKNKLSNDGYFNKCKNCCIEYSKKREKHLRSNDATWLEMERRRCRNKHKNTIRNNSSKKTELYRLKFPEKYKARTACFRLKRNNKGSHFHHWSYNEDHMTDVIELTIKDHAKAHRFIIYDKEFLMYRRLDNNELLDNKKDHFEYISYCIEKYED